MNRRLFSYTGNDGQECHGVYSTETVELAAFGSTHVFVLGHAVEGQTYILHNPRTAESALHAVLVDQSIPLESEHVFVTVLNGLDASDGITQIATDDFSVKDNGEVSMRDNRPFNPEDIVEPVLARSLVDLVAHTLQYVKEKGTQDQ